MTGTIALNAGGEPLPTPTYEVSSPELRADRTRSSRSELNYELTMAAFKMEDGVALEEREAALCNLCEAGDSLESYLKGKDDFILGYALHVIDNEIAKIRARPLERKRA